jgi:hypothetical protein
VLLALPRHGARGHECALPRWAAAVFYLRLRYTLYGHGKHRGYLVPTIRYPASLDVSFRCADLVVRLVSYPDYFRLIMPHSPSSHVCTSEIWTQVWAKPLTCTMLVLYRAKLPAK